MTEVYRFCGKTTSNGLKIIYEDNHVISVVKPEGILSQSDISGEIDLLTMIKEDLKVRYNKKGEAYTGLVHRLDRNTGGTMIFAKTSKGASRLSAQLRENKFKKGYFAISMGIIRNDGILENRLLKDPTNNKVFESKDGKLSVLKYRVLAHIDNTTLLFVTPITGRTHQIRVQLSLNGHPLLGDTKYGFNENDLRQQMPSHLRQQMPSHFPQQMPSHFPQQMPSHFLQKMALWSSLIACKHVTEEKTLLLQSIPNNDNYWAIYEKEIYTNTLDNLGEF